MPLEDALAKIPGLAGYLGQQQFQQQQQTGQIGQMGSLLKIQEMMRQRQQEQELNQALKASGGNLEQALPALIQAGHIKGEHLTAAMKLLSDAQAKKEAIQAMKELNAPTTSAPQAPVELGIGQPAGGAPEAPVSGSAPSGNEDRIAKLKAMQVQYAGNSTAATAIQKEIDKLENTTQSPSVHLVKDTASPTGWSHADVKTGKILMKGAPPPANQELSISPAATKSAAAQVAAGMPLSQVVPGYGRTIGPAREQVRQQAVSQIMSETGMNEAQAGEELANRNIAFAAGKRSTTQLTTMLGATRQAVDQLDFNVKKVTEQMDKLGGGGLVDISPVVTAIARGAQKWTGDPAYSSLFYYMHAAGMESARILQGGQASIAQLHQGAADQAQQWASANMTTPKAWREGVAPAMTAEGRERIKTYERALASAKVGQQNPAPPPSPNSPSASSVPVTATGPNGQKLKLEGGQWVPM